MAIAATSQQVFEALLDSYGSKIADAYLESISDVNSGIDNESLYEAIKRNDFDAVLFALHLDPASFIPLDAAVSSAFYAGGNIGAKLINAAARAVSTNIAFRFGGRNTNAERWVASHSSTLITNITSDQVEAVRLTLRSGIERGDGPRTIALSIAGRVNNKTGKREGGIVGLSAQQASYVDNARNELMSGNPALLKNYLSRTARDARFDRTVLKAIADKKALTREKTEQIAQAYAKKLLKVRADTIGRTESLHALHAGQHQAFQQAIFAGQVAADQVTKTWDATMDMRTRDAHRKLNGVTVGFYAAFVSELGNRLLYPGDTSLGATAADLINCRCYCRYRIRFTPSIYEANNAG